MRPLPEGLDGVQLKQHRDWLQCRIDVGLWPGLDDSDSEHSDDEAEIEANSDKESLFS